jgi:TonB family protein
MRVEWALLVCVSILSDGLAQTKKTDLVGYIYCASDETQHLTQVFLDPCIKVPVGNLSCGQKLEVVSQSGLWLKVVTADGITRFVSSGAVSQRPDQLVLLDIEAGPPQECKIAEPKNPKKNHPPHAVFSPAPDYPASSSRSGVQGTVLIGFVVGIDGLPHDLKIVASVDKDLDKKALEAVQQWRFEPAVKDGQPVEAPLEVSVSFRQYH